MATKNYMINDKWLDLDKQNIVELQSVDGVLDSMKVNGSEIETPSGKITITENGTDIDVAQYALADVNVEGGGGGGDFSTAEVTFICSAGSYSLCHSAIENDNLIAGVMDIVYDDESLTVMIPMLNGQAILDPSAFYDIDTGVMPISTGSIEFGQDGFVITGNGTITFKGLE